MDLAWNYAVEAQVGAFPLSVCLSNTPPPSPANHRIVLCEQAQDRVHRIGQTKPVDIHRLTTVGTIEEKIMDLQEKKKALADGAFGEGQ